MAAAITFKCLTISDELISINKSHQSEVKFCFTKVMALTKAVWKTDFQSGIEFIDYVDYSTINPGGGASFTTIDPGGGQNHSNAKHTVRPNLVEKKNNLT